MTERDSASLDRPGDPYRSTLLLGAVLALGLGVLRGGEQVVAQHAYARSLRMVWMMALASAFWLPVPALAQRVLRVNLGKRQRWIAVGVAAVLVSVLEPVWFFGVLALVADWHPRGAYWINGALRLDTNLLIAGAIVGWLWLRAVQDRRAAAAERAMALRSRATSAELDVLTMQLQPHFLFNTLNLVSQLAYESTARARRAIHNLRRLLEESVGIGHGATVSLAEELRFLDAYLDLQRDRFGPRLDARVVAEVDLLDARVPRMLLQPLVENAIRHGIAPRKSGGSVNVRVRRAPGERVSIEVADDGIGLPGDAARYGMGLTNVRHRLEQLYPDAVMMDLSPRNGGGATTRLEFPFDARPARAVAELSDDDSTIAVADDAPWNTSGGLRAIVMILGWCVMAAIWSELEAIVPLASHRSVPWDNLFGQNFLIAGVWIALTPLVVRFADRVATKRRSVRLLAHGAGAVVFAGLHLVATGALMRLLAHADDARVLAFQVGWAAWDVTAYAMLVTIGETLAARARLREQRVDAARAAERLTTARVALMRLHLQPSLLLSAIDAVDAAIGDPVRCETTITRLGDVLRILLAVGGNEETTLRNELALLDGYGAVVGRRVVVVSAEPGDLETIVPAVVLCPLVSATGAAPLQVDVSRRGTRLVIAVVMDGSLTLPDDVLAATDRRLAAIYGVDHAVRLVRRVERTTIVLEVPHRVSNMAAQPVLADRAIA